MSSSGDKKTILSNTDLSLINSCKYVSQEENVDANELKYYLFRIYTFLWV